VNFHRRFDRPLTVRVATYYGTVLRRQGKAAGSSFVGGFAV
jgi:hypothetical protein